MITTPKTIEELIQWYEDRNLPPYETTRFFIGENYTGARAFGIYKEGDFVTVYKNKNDGTRAIRYTGTDEEFAVNEIFQKLLSEIASQKEKNGKTVGKPKKDTVKTVLSAIALVFVFILGINSCREDKKGYYYYKNNLYYCYKGNWYLFDDASLNYVKVTPEKELKKNCEQYSISDEYYSDYGAIDFYSSDTYESIAEREAKADSDSDYDWDSGDSWDSDGTDFDSDW